MKASKNICILLIMLQSFLGYSQYTNNYFVTTGTVLTPQAACSNVDFENLDFSGWYAYYGYNNDGLTGIDDGVVSISNAASLPTTTRANSPYSSILSDRIFEQIGLSYSDPYISTPVHSGSHSLRIGTMSGSSYKAGMKQRVTVTNANAVFELSYALVMGHDAGHTMEGQPFFRFYLEDAAHNKIDCSEILEIAGLMSGAVNTGPPSSGFPDPIYYKDWTTVSINLLDYVNLNDDITIGFEIVSCELGGHFGYAYIDGQCLPGNIPTDYSTHCLENDVTFPYPIVTAHPPGSFEWRFYDNPDGTGSPAVSYDSSPSWDYSQYGEGEYLVTFFAPNNYNGCLTKVYQEYVTIESCCTDCPTINLNEGERYWISAWVQEDHGQEQISYDLANIQLNFLEGYALNSTVQFYPSGEIIDGWQKIVGEFVLPANISQMTIALNANPSYDTYFDDIRIHPFNGSMKSYIYDPETYFLTAELDDK